MTSAGDPSPPRKLLHVVITAFTLGVIYLLVKAPLLRCYLGYYDNGETLYHTLSMLSGRIPYLDDFNHHFMGYVLEFAAAARVFGFSPALVAQVAVLNQALTGLGVFLCLRFFVGLRPAFLGAALAVVAAEPWVLGFYQQFQTNLLSVFVWFFCLRYIKHARLTSLTAAGLLAGLALTFDQRLVFVAILPVAAVLLAERRSLPHAAIVLLAAAIAPLLGLAYLASHGALGPFIEQTLIYPAHFRSGSSSLWQTLLGGVSLYGYLVAEPQLAIMSVISVITSVKLALRARAGDTLSLFVLAVALVMLPMPFFGGRDYEYYVVPWHPYLALLTGCSFLFAARLPRRALRWYRIIAVLPLLLAFVESGRAWSSSERASCTDDGVHEVVALLKEELLPSDTLYVWGYRMDIYVYLERLSSYPFASQIMIRPDHMIVDPELRRRHIYPQYERYFFALLDRAPPDYLVIFRTSASTGYFSEADERVTRLANEQYQHLMHLERDNITGKRSVFDVYRRPRG